MPREKITRRQKNISRLLRERKNIQKDKLKTAKKMKSLFLLIALLLMPSFSLAQEGFDYDSYHYIDIHSRKEKDIYFFDFNDGNQHHGEIIDKEWGWGGYRLKIFDYDTGKIRYFEMEDD